MNKIKILSVLIFVLSLTLAYYSKYVSEVNDININFLRTINKQKTFTQEISKNIFYIYNNRDLPTEQLDKLISVFIKNINHRDAILKNITNQNIKEQTTKILKSWNNFYLLVQKFLDLNKIDNAYTNIILEKLMNNIYKVNRDFVVEFDKLIAMHKAYFDEVKQREKIIQITLYILLLALLIYFFTQLKELLIFIQKFLDTSKKILQKSTVHGIEPIQTETKSKDITHALHDFNFFIEKINRSIDYSVLSIDKSVKSLEYIEKDIEDLLELITTMDENRSFDKKLLQKEDILIESLDELNTIVKKMQQLQINLSNFKN